jgi:hypothetical protein
MKLLLSSTVLIILIGLLSGCAPKLVTVSELASNLRSLHSQAAETSLFIEYVEAGKATSQYVRAHVIYVAEEAREASEKINAHAEPRLDLPLAECRQQYRLLARQLERLCKHLDDPFTLADVKQKLQQIQEVSDQIRRGL